MSKPLSPASQAVIDAVVAASPRLQERGIRNTRSPLIAAALRAAVEQVLPDLQEPDWGACDYMQCDIELYTDHQRKRAALLAIATELEKHQ